MIFRLYTIYDKHDMIKIDNQTRIKLQVFSKVLYEFCCCLYMAVFRHVHLNSRKTKVMERLPRPVFERESLDWFMKGTEGMIIDCMRS